MRRRRVAVESDVALAVLVVVLVADELVVGVVIMASVVFVLMTGVVEVSESTVVD